MDTVDHRDRICFRCGQMGHARYQCLTYRIRMCPYAIACTDSNCRYAHSMAELRRPWEIRCVRVVRQGTRFMCIGCNSRDHTFRNCPIHNHVIMM